MSNIGQTRLESRFYPGLMGFLPGDTRAKRQPPGALGRNAAPHRLIAKEKKMSTGTKDEVKGTAHEVKGAVKSTTGKVTGDSRLEAEGHTEKAAGKVQKKDGEVEKVLEK
jgi:uncharacterized protein YjbJ (UPF0337 family)